MSSEELMTFRYQSPGLGDDKRGASLSFQEKNPSDKIRRQKDQSHDRMQRDDPAACWEYNHLNKQPGANDGSPSYYQIDLGMFFFSFVEGEVEAGVFWWIIKEGILST